MNIERLAKRLKEFTLDDIELIAECDCKTKLEQLLNSNKILFENGIYKYNEETKTGENYEIFSPLKNKHLKISIEDAKEYFMKIMSKNTANSRLIETITQFSISILYRL